MNIENRLDLQAKAAKDNYGEYLTDPENFSEIDQLEFQQAYQAKTISEWAVVTKLTSSYEVAKKIIDSI